MIRQQQNKDTVMRHVMCESPCSMFVSDPIILIWNRVKFYMFHTFMGRYQTYQHDSSVLSLARCFVSALVFQLKRGLSRTAIEAFGEYRVNTRGMLRNMYLDSYTRELCLWQKEETLDIYLSGATLLKLVGNRLEFWSPKASLLKQLYKLWKTS
jgi:hypothetical protein